MTDPMRAAKNLDAKTAEERREAAVMESVRKSKVFPVKKPTNAFEYGNAVTTMADILKSKGIPEGRAFTIAHKEVHNLMGTGADGSDDRAFDVDRAIRQDRGGHLDAVGERDLRRFKLVSVSAGVRAEVGPG